MEDDFVKWFLTATTGLALLFAFLYQMGYFPDFKITVFMYFAVEAVILVLLLNHFYDKNNK